MGRRKKNTQNKRRRKAARKREKARSRGSAPAPQQAPVRAARAPGVPEMWPTVHVTAAREIIPDPRETLGLPTDRVPSPEQVQAAWKAAILENPPEHSPDLARDLRAARERLIAPERFIERELGALSVPRPEAFGLLAPSAAAAAPAPKMDALGRLMGQMLLYTLVEEELWSRAPRGALRRRPDPRRALKPRRAVAAVAGRSSSTSGG